MFTAKEIVGSEILKNNTFRQRILKIVIFKWKDVICDTFWHQIWLDYPFFRKEEENEANSILLIKKTVMYSY